MGVTSHRDVTCKCERSAVSMAIADSGERLPLTRDTILSEAVEILKTHGIAGFRLKDLASNMGVTIPTLYRYFEDREDIVTSAYVRALQIQAEDIDALLSDDNPAFESMLDIYDFFQLIFGLTATGDLREHRLVRLRAMAATSHDEHLRREVSESFQIMDNAVMRVIERGQREGIIDPTVDAGSLSLLLRSIALGLALWDFDPSREGDLTEYWAVVSRAFSAFRVDRD